MTLASALMEAVVITSCFQKQRLVQIQIIGSSRIAVKVMFHLLSRRKDKALMVASKVGVND